MKPNRKYVLCRRHGKKGQQSWDVCIGVGCNKLRRKYVEDVVFYECGWKKEKK